MNKRRSLCGLLALCLCAGCAPQGQAPSSEPQQPAEVWQMTQQTADRLLDFMQQDAELYLTYNEQQRLLQQYDRQTAEDTRYEQVALITSADGEDITERLRSLSEQDTAVLLCLQSGSYTLSQSVTLPDTVLVRFEQGAFLQIQQGAALTVCGLLDAPQKAHLFSGQVCLQANQQVAFAQWFGAKGNGRDDDTAALQAALDACAQVCLPYTQGGYVIGDVAVPQGRTLFGDGAQRSILRAATDSRVMLRVTGSDVTMRHLEWRLQDMQSGAAALLLDNEKQPLQHIELRDIYTDKGYTVVRDVGDGQPISDLRFYEVDCRDPGDTTFLLRDCVALLHMRHCVTDYNVKTVVYQQSVQYPAYRISRCAGILMQQCDVLGSYTEESSRGNHAFVLQDCAAVLMDRVYCDTLSGMGIWFKQVQYATLKNCGAGLNNDVGLLMEHCSRVQVVQLKQFGRWELGGEQKVDGIVLRSCSHITLENVQSLCNLGNALVLQDSRAVTAYNLTAYLNGGAALVETGSSNGNLVSGMSVIYSASPPCVLSGADSAVQDIVYNDGGYSPASTGNYQPTIGTYTAVQVADAAAPTLNMAAVQQAYAAADTRLQIERERLSSAQKITSAASDVILAGGCNVRDFGAVGDGVSDDTQAILQALQAGEDIYFPAGSYRITKRVFLPKESCFTFASGAYLLIEQGADAYLSGQVRAPAEHILRGTVSGKMSNDYGYAQWFGAAGDGKTDDTAAFNEAFKHLNKVVVPETPNGYLVGRIRMSSYQVLCGEGVQAPVLKATADVQHWFTPQTGVQIYDLVLDMQAAGNEAVCLYFDTAARGMDRMRFYNLTVLGAGHFVADADSGNRNLVANTHFDNITVLAARAEAFYMTDFFGFIFLRNVTVDYQGNTALHDAFYVRTNYGMVLEDCIVQNSADDSTGAAYRFCDSWAIWTDRCTAKKVGGAGFVTQDIKHCYLFNCTADETGGLGFDLGGVYYQFYGLTAEKTAGVLLHDGYYLTLGRLQVSEGDVQVQRCNTVLMHDVCADALSEAQGDFLLCIRTADTAVSLQGKHSAYRR